MVKYTIDNVGAESLEARHLYVQPSPNPRKYYCCVARIGLLLKVEDALPTLMIPVTVYESSGDPMFI